MFKDSEVRVREQRASKLRQAIRNIDRGRRPHWNCTSPAAGPFAFTAVAMCRLLWLGVVKLLRKLEVWRRRAEFFEGKVPARLRLGRAG